MYAIDNDQDKSAVRASWKRRSFRHRWIKLGSFVTALTVVAFYFCYYYQDRHQAVSALNTLLTSVTGKKVLEHDHLPVPDFEHDQELPLTSWTTHAARGALYMIVRNQNLPEARSAMRTIQDRFNDEAKYPWILLNDQHFTADFKRHASAIVSHSNISLVFGKIDTDAWTYPWWIDVPRAEQTIHELSDVQRRRYQSGLVFHHPLFANVEYTWRIDPGVLYTCTLEEDPFLVMKHQQKKLGFVLTAKQSVSTLWPHTLQFMQKHPEWIKNQTILPWVERWHMQSNFEILDLSFVRSEAYQAYFDYLDQTGGFFYEKWEDAIRTFAAAMFLNKHQIHFFDNIGYTKDDQSHCPLRTNYLQKCACDLVQSHDLSDNSGTLDLLRLIAPMTFQSVSDLFHVCKVGLAHATKKVGLAWWIYF